MISHMWHASLDTRRETYDLVHIHSTDPCLLAWLPRARWGVVATSHGQAYNLKKWNPVARWMSKLAERFFIYLPKILTSVSRPLADYYQGKYRREVRYIPNGVRVMKKPDAACIRKWDIEPEGYLFCSAGRFERTKGIHTLLEAYARLKTSLPLIIAGGGNGSDSEYMNELLHAKPAGVKFVGFLTGDSLFALYAHARAFVFPSENEAMSMAFLEGLSFGTPTVYSNIPANETVANGLGYSFAVADAEALAETLEYVLGHNREARERGRQGTRVSSGKSITGRLLPHSTMTFIPAFAEYDLPAINAQNKYFADRDPKDIESPFIHSRKGNFQWDSKCFWI